MRSVNKVFLMGHVGQDPKIVSTPGGRVLASLSLATSHYTKDTKMEIVEWHNLVAWDRTAEIIRDYVVKGSPLHIEGQLKTRRWGKDGEKRYTTEIVIREISLLNSKAGDASKGTWGRADSSSPEITDEDIPL